MGKYLVLFFSVMICAAFAIIVIVTTAITAIAVTGFVTGQIGWISVIGWIIVLAFSFTIFLGSLLFVEYMIEKTI